ncbi:MAG TPA: hypothetical protein ENI74_10445 [Gammaproteobacteria bacterium]|nr:hypothetical protein [Gammaproteobacteria bacterium]
MKSSASPVRRVFVNRRFSIFSLLLLTTGAVHAEVTGSVLWYLEQEPGIEPYKVRYLVTENFMRSDEGDGEGGFALFNRSTRQIYSVDPEVRTVLSIDGQGKTPKTPRRLDISIKQHVDSEFPRIAGKVPVTVELNAGGELCDSAVVIPGFPGPARAAFQEFARSLAIQQKRTLANTPSEYQTPCFLSRYIYAGDFYLQQGVPLLEWDGKGKRRELINFQIGVGLDEHLFELPEGFETIRAGGQQGAP